MVKKFTLTINNDLKLSLNYQVSINNKIHKGKVDKGMSKYIFESNDEQPTIKIMKENKWVLEQKLNTIFMFLFTLDLVWGNVFDSDNLPFGTDITVVATQQKIELSNVYNTSSNSLKRWNKAANLQALLVTMILIVTSLMLSMILPMPLNILAFIIFGSGISILLFKIILKINFVKKILEGFIID